MASSRLVLTNTLANTIGRMWPKVLALAVVRWLMPYLGETGWAVYSVGLTVMLLATLLDPGVQNGQVKVFAEFLQTGRARDFRRLLGASLVLYAVFGAALTGAAALAVGPILRLAGVVEEARESAAFLFLCLIGHLALINLSAAFANGLFAQQRMRLANAALVLADAMHYAALFAVVAFDWRLRGVGMVFLATAALKCVLLAGAAWPFLPRPGEGTPAPLPVRALLRRALPFGFRLRVAANCETFVSNIDKLFVANFVRFQAAGVYHFGWTPAVVLRDLVRSFVSALLPAATGAALGGGPERLRRANRLATRWFFTAAVPCLLFPAALAPSIIQAWLGRPEPDAANVLALLACAFLLHTAPAASMEVAAGAHRPGLQMRAALGGAALCLVLNALLVGPLGILGPPTATLLGLGAAAAWYVRAACRLWGDSPWSFVAHAYLRPLAAGGALAFALRALEAGLLRERLGGWNDLAALALLGALWATATALYAAAAFALGQWTRADLARLRRDVR